MNNSIEYVWKQIRSIVENEYNASGSKDDSSLIEYWKKAKKGINNRNQPKKVKDAILERIDVEIAKITRKIEQEEIKKQQEAERRKMEEIKECLFQLLTSNIRKI